MAKPARVSVSEFRGQSTEFHRAKLPADLHQVDEGSDHFQKGSWKVRKGMLHTDLPQGTGAITTLLGFVVPDGNYGLLYVAGTSVNTALNVGTQDYGSPGGFGEGGFGEGGFGE